MKYGYVKFGTRLNSRMIVLVGQFFDFFAVNSRTRVGGRYFTDFRINYAQTIANVGACYHYCTLKIGSFPATMAPYRGDDRNKTSSGKTGGSSSSQNSSTSNSSATDSGV